MEEFAELMNAITNSDRFSAISKIVKERGEKSVYTIMFDEAEERGEARGEIKGTIKTYYDDFGVSPKEILQKIIRKFSLQEAEAKAYVEETLGVKLSQPAPKMAEDNTGYSKENQS